jgi:chorismate-pyruvate lyase
VSAPPRIAAWLTQEGALSDALLQKNAQMALIAQHRMADLWIREVLFHNTLIPLTYGRVVMPYSTYQHHQAVLDALGNRPIGKTLLYANPTVTRSAFEFACLDETHLLFQQACRGEACLAHRQDTPRPDIGPPLWARRSLFMWENHPLSITEVFFL